MIVPSALNLVIVMLMVIIGSFLWNVAAAKLSASENSLVSSAGGGMATVL